MLSAVRIWSMEMNLIESTPALASKPSRIQRVRSRAPRDDRWNLFDHFLVNLWTPICCHLFFAMCGRSNRQDGERFVTDQN
jgi:hypothetical protein